MSQGPVVEASIRLTVDDANLGTDMRRSAERAADQASRGASSKVSGGFVQGLRDGIRQGVQEADAGGAKTGGAFRTGLQNGLRQAVVDSEGRGRDAAGRFTKGASKGVEDAKPELAKASGSVADHAVKAFAAVWATGRVFDFFKTATTAASDLAETGSKVEQLFGAGSDAIQAFASTADTRLGQSRQSALDAASTFAIFGRSAGLSGQELVGFSTRFVKMASDFASFHNTTPEEAITAIGAAFRGESEPIRKYGILLDDASLKNTALKLGLIETTTQALTPQQRVLAVQAEIMRQAGAATDDFARTSEGLANQQRILSARWENAKAALGQGLLPVALKTVDVLNGLITFGSGVVDTFQALPPPIRAVLEVLAGVTATGGAAVLVTGKIASAAESLGDAFSLLKAQGSALSNFLLGPWGIALGAAAIAVGIFATKHAEAKQRVADLTAAIKADSGALGENTRSTVANALEKEGVLRSAQKLGISLSDLTDSVLGQGDAQARVNQILQAAQVETTGLAQSSGRGASAHVAYSADVIKVRNALGQQSGALVDARDAADRLTAATKGTSTATGVLTVEQQEAAAKAAAIKTATDNLTNSLRANNNMLLIVRGGVRGWEAAIDNADDAVRENGKTLNVHTEKGRANQQALDDLAGAGLDYLDVIRQQKGPGKEFADALEVVRQRLIREAEKFGASKSEAKKYADQILAMPKKYALDVTTPGSAQAKSELEKIKDHLLGLPGKVRVDIGIGGGKFALSAGGKLPGGPSTVDSIPAMLAPGEYVVNAAATARHEPLLRAINEGGLRGYAAGGKVGFTNLEMASGATGDLDAAFGAATTRWEKLLRSFLIPNLASAAGVSAMMSVLHRAFPGLALISGYRPGAITATGNPSYHGANRAVDVPPSMDVFNWIAKNYGANTKELIYSPAGDRQIKNGQPHYYTGVTRAMHFNHVHWAYETGGLAREAGILAKGPKPERILDPAQTAAFERALDRGFGGDVRVHVYLDGEPIRAAARVEADNAIGRLSSATNAMRSEF